MASERHIAHTKGSLGELDVARRLIMLGCSVNQLTASDTGWDIHAHLPESFVELDFEDTQASWPLSARVLHVQVKSFIERSVIKIPVHQVRTWIEGTAYGVVTVVAGVSVSETGSTHHAFWFPDDQADWVRSHSTEQAPTVPFDRFYLVQDDRLLHAVFELWTKKPTAMLKLGAMKLLRFDEIQADIACQRIVRDLAHSFLYSFNRSLRGGEREAIKVLERLSSEITYGSDGRWSVDAPLLEEMSMPMLDTRFRDELGEPLLPLASLTMRQEEGAALDELSNLARDIGHLIPMVRQINKQFKDS